MESENAEELRFLNRIKLLLMGNEHKKRETDDVEVIIWSTNVVQMGLIIKQHEPDEVKYRKRWSFLY